MNTEQNVSERRESLPHRPSEENPVQISERVFSTAENPELSTLALWGGNEPRGQLYVDFA